MFFFLVCFTREEERNNRLEREIKELNIALDGLRNAHDIERKQLNTRLLELKEVCIDIHIDSVLDTFVFNILRHYTMYPLHRKMNVFAKLLLLHNTQPFEPPNKVF